MEPEVLRKPGGRGLTEAGARKGLEMRRSGHTYQQIAAILGCSTGTVFNVCNGDSWAWLRS